MLPPPCVTAGTAFVCVSKLQLDSIYTVMYLWCFYSEFNMCLGFNHSFIYCDFIVLVNSSVLLLLWFIDFFIAFRIIVLWFKLLSVNTFISSFSLPSVYFTSLLVRLISVWTLTLSVYLLISYKPPHTHTSGFPSLAPSVPLSLLIPPQYI